MSSVFRTVALESSVDDKVLIASTENQTNFTVLSITVADVVQGEDQTACVSYEDLPELITFLTDELHRHDLTYVDADEDQDADEDEEVPV